MHWRKIEVDNVLYEFYIGKQNVVVKNTETKKKTIVELNVISGMTWDKIERAKWKKYFSVVPAKIAAYIERQKL